MSSDNDGTVVPRMGVVWWVVVELIMVMVHGASGGDNIDDKDGRGVEQVRGVEASEGRWLVMVVAVALMVMKSP